MNAKLAGEIVAGLNTQQKRDNPAEMRRRIATLERALRNLLAVAWPNEDCPDSRTNVAIRKAQEALK